MSTRTVVEPKSFDVKINELEPIWDKGEGRIVKIDRLKRFNDEVIGINSFIAVYKALKSVEKDVKDLDMLEVKVDGVNFPG